MFRLTRISSIDQAVCDVGRPGKHRETMSSNKELEVGGYDYDFVEEVPLKYICSICTEVLRKACLAECCGQHYCDSCLAQWLRRCRQRSCPHCRTVHFQSVLNKEKMREINKFRIRCIHHICGCEWVGELGTLTNHLQSDSVCQCVKVECGNDAYTDGNGHGLKHVTCGANMERRHLAKHKESECMYRQMRCGHCGYVDTYDAIVGSGQVRKRDSNIKNSQNHCQTCDHLPVECVNKCGKVNIKRKDMRSHQDVCPLEVLKCPFNNLCTDDIFRKDMESHKEECDFRPYTCEYCGIVGVFVLITGEGKVWMPTGPSHYEKCEHYPVDCINKCGEKNIKRKEMSSHQKSCPLEPLDCPFGKHLSGKQILRKDMDTHKTVECEHRPYTCQYCNLCGTYQFITGDSQTPLKGKCHHDVCDHYPLDCPNQCGARNIKRRKMSLHRGKCGLEPLDCPFKYANCTLKILRKNMDYHCQKNVQNHMLLISQAHQELAHKCEELSSKNDQLTRKNDELAHKVEELTPKTLKRARH